MGGRPTGSAPPLYTSALVYTAVQVAFISFLCSYYGVETGPVVRPALGWTVEQLQKLPMVQRVYDAICGYFTEDADDGESESRRQRAEASTKRAPSGADGHTPLDADLSHLHIFTSEQLSFFDGSRPSKDVYLALLGRVYNVQKGQKHYAPGGGYHFFAGKDASRAFVTGDFTDAGLIDDVRGLTHQDLIGLLDWSKFYEKTYQMVGLLQGTYYDADGRITQRMREVIALIEDAQHWKARQTKQAEVFPPCNSEWHKDAGGRVWCSTKSGGIQREWSGVPRKLYNPGTKTYRCACVKNFGAPLSKGGEEDGSSRGDLDNPNLREYANCPPTSNSCRIQED